MDPLNNINRLVFDSWFWILAFLLVFLVGCESWGPKVPTAMPAEYAAIVTNMTEMVKDQGVIDNFAANARAHGLNPGIKSSIGIEIYGKIGLDGVDADVSGDTSGTGTLLSTGTRDALISDLRALEGRTDPSAIESRAAILRILDQLNRPTSRPTTPEGTD